MFDIDESLKETYKQILDIQKNENPLLRLNVAALSPLKEDNEIDQERFFDFYSELSDRIDFSSMLLAGATGEGEYLEDKHLTGLYEAGLKLKQEKGTHLIGGSIRKKRDDVLRVAEFWASRDVDYLMVAMPTEEEMTQDEIGELLKEICNLGKPVIVYRTGLSKTLPDLTTIINSKVYAVKDTTGKDDSLFTKVDELYAADKLLLQGNDRWFYESFTSSLENGADYFGNISGGCNLVPFADLRNIIGASLLEAKKDSLSAKAYNSIARTAQYIMIYAFDILFHNMDAVGDKKYGGRREAPILTSAVDATHKEFRTKSANSELNEYPNKGFYNGLFNLMAYARDRLLQEYKTLKSL